jgi:hypothetical protein
MLALALKQRSTRTRTVDLGPARQGGTPMSTLGAGPRPTWIPGHARRHERTGELDNRWMPACQCGWAFYASVRTLRVADRTHGFHLDRVHSSRGIAAS